MRLWSLHPQYLDTKGLIALWREALLAKHVLEGKTRGYKNHPQLIRFKATDRPVDSINQYLSAVYEEAVKRGYNFDKDKIDRNYESTKIPLTVEQLRYERTHLLNKLKMRDRSKYNDLLSETEIQTHPIFVIIDGKIEEGEIIKK